MGARVFQARQGAGRLARPPPRARSRSRAARRWRAEKPGARGLNAERAGMHALLQPPFPSLGAVRPHGR